MSSYSAAQRRTMSPKIYTYLSPHDWPIYPLVTQTNSHSNYLAIYLSETCQFCLNEFKSFFVSLSVCGINQSCWYLQIDVPPKVFQYQLSSTVVRSHWFLNNSCHEHCHEVYFSTPQTFYSLKSATHKSPKHWGLSIYKVYDRLIPCRSRIPTSPISVRQGINTQ